MDKFHLPLVSVIMAVYNEENTVTSVLDNLLAGDFKEFEIEIVLVESNSTDLTRQLIST
jgi:glycosyltransferase involved in cell wall biosynthesis